MEVNGPQGKEEGHAWWKRKKIKQRGKIRMEYELGIRLEAIYQKLLQIEKKIDKETEEEEQEGSAFDVATRGIQREEPEEEPEEEQDDEPEDDDEPEMPPPPPPPKKKKKKWVK